MSMTMAQILRATPYDRKNKSSYVRIKEVKVSKTSYGTKLFKAKTSSTHSLTGTPKKGDTIHTYVTTVETNDKMVVISCSCADFMFRWEYALNKRKAARLEYCNGEPPIDTNPNLVPGCCGHVVKFASLLISKGKVA